MSFGLPKVYPLTDVQLSGLSHADQVRRLAAGGATLVQLREKQMPGRDFYLAAKAAIEVARELRILLIINDRIDIAVALRADGVHLGQDDLPVEAARLLMGPQAIIGISTHNISQAKSAHKLPIDYLAIGPVFATQSKKNSAPVVDIEGLKEVRRLTAGRPLVAIGGINEDNAVEVIKAGADSVAVISCLLASPEGIAERTSRLLRTLT